MSNIDLITRSFAALESIANINSHQIIIFDGSVAFELLQKAIERAVLDFPLLLSRYNSKNRSVEEEYWSPVDIPFYYIKFDQELSFSDSAFRQELTEFSQKHPLKWSIQPPIQFVFFSSASGNKTGFMFNVNHSVADAQSDSFLVERIASYYKDLTSKESNNIRYIVKNTNNYSINKEDFDSKLDNKPRKINGTTGYLREVIRDIFYRVRYAKKFSSTKWDIKTVDFYHELLDEKMTMYVKEVCNKTKQTVNTVFIAALCSALEAYHGKSNIRIMCPISLRKYMGEDSANNYQNFMVPCNVVIPKKYLDENELMNHIANQVNIVKKGGYIAHLLRLSPMIHILEKIKNKIIANKLVLFFQGTNACYSNPGAMKENYKYFGTKDLSIYQYIGFGCLIEPYDFILYTPTINGELYLNVVYRRDKIQNIKKYLIEPIKEYIVNTKLLCSGPDVEFKYNIN